MRIGLIIVPAMVVLLGAIGLKLNLTQEISNPSSLTVDLSGKNLKEIPIEFKEEILKAEVLILDNNQLVKLPAWLKEAGQLERISINQNPEFDFFQFCVDFQEMTHLKEMDLSHCNITLIPYQLTFFTKLENLNLSHNSIVNVPYHFSFITSLKECNLSDNLISEVGFSFRDLSRLRNLNISGNEKLNTRDLIISLEKSELDFLCLDFNDSIPEQMKAIVVKTLVAGFGKKTIYANNFIPDECADLTIKGSTPKLSNEQLVFLSKANSIQNLQLSGFNLDELPLQIKKMAALKTLDITSCGISSIKNTDEMKQLTALKISENSLTLDQIQQLKQNLPLCTIASDEDRLKGNGIALTVTPPIKEATVPIEKKNIDPKIESEFISETGTTTLEIPANSFLDDKGNIITTPVEIQFREFNDPASVLLSGIPMQIKNEDGTTGDFSSAGMFEFNAFSDGKPVYPNPKSLITANILSNQSTPYDLYTFQNGKGWTKAQATPVIAQRQTNVNNDIAENQALPMNYADYGEFVELERMKMILNDTILKTRGFIGLPKIGLILKKLSSEKTFKVNFSFYQMNKYSNNGDLFFKVDCPEAYREIISSNLKYNDYQMVKDFATMDSIRKDLKKVYAPKRKRNNNRKKKNRLDYSENVIVKDIKITPDILQDDYILSFNYRGRIVKFHVIPEEEGNAASVQNQNLRFYQNFLYGDRLYSEAMDKAKNNYSEYYENLEARMRTRNDSLRNIFSERNRLFEENIKKNGQSVDGYKEMFEKTAKMQYTFQVASFGLSNCDIVSRMNSPRKVRASFKDILGRTLLFIKMIRIDKRLSSISYFEPGNDFVVDYSHNETALLFILPDGNYGVVDSENLSRNRENKEIEVKPLENSKLDPKYVRSML